MNKKSIIIIFIVIVFIVCGGIIFKKYTNNDNLNNNDDNNSYNEEIINENNQGESFDYENIEFIYELSVPDKIIYYYNGDKIEISKDMKEFSEIINLHRQSYTNNGEINMLQLYVDNNYINSMINSKNILVYNYAEKESFYFTLNEKNEETNLIITLKDDVYFTYGATMSNTVLIDYLNKLI